MGISTFQLAEWLSQLAAKRVWFGLFFEDPESVSNPLTAEIAGVSYSRPKVAWSRPSPVLLRNSGVLRWTGLTAGTAVAAVGGFNKAVGGDLLFSSTEGITTTVAAGGAYVLPSASYYVGLDAILTGP